jgi:formiminotetrahydrofolate cyclodeaminase
MVARLTVGKANNPVLDETMSTFIDRASHLRIRLMSDVDRDSDAYGAVMKGYRMPKVSEEEQNARTSAIQDALKEAARVPLSVAEAGVTLLTLARRLVREGNSSAMSDAVVAALMARSAVIGALFNVRINVASIKDSVFRKEMEQRTESLEREAMEIETEVLTMAASAMVKGP